MLFKALGMVADCCRHFNVRGRVEIYRNINLALTEFDQVTLFLFFVRRPSVCETPFFHFHSLTATHVAKTHHTHHGNSSTKEAENESTSTKAGPEEPNE